jgi:energy-converting hydrogenase Eha subunit H
MLLGIGILVAAFVAAVRTVLVLHAGWNRGIASLAAFAICPLLFLGYALSIEDSIEGGLAMMIGLPVAILAGLAALAIVVIGDVCFWTGGTADQDRDEN